MKNNKSVGVIAGNFDVIHPGYIKMFNEMRIHVDEIHVFLHINPSLERKEKIKPVLSEFDRVETLLALKGVNNVSSYQTENELKKQVKGNFERFIQIGCYKGLRVTHHLPLRGQRTHTNAKSAKKLVRP